MKINNPVSNHDTLGGVSTSDHHVLYTNAEALAAVEAAAEITIQGQITFPATQSASAGANVLDDYEEGVFTPTLADGNQDGTGEGQAYSNRVGRYVKIGRIVFITLRMTITDLGTLSTGDSWAIMGLPFPCVNVANANGGLQVHAASSLGLSSAGQVVTGEIMVNSSRIDGNLWDATTGTTLMLISELADGTVLRCTGWYEV